MLMASLIDGVFEKVTRFVARDMFTIKIVPLILRFTPYPLFGHITMI